MLTGLEPEQIIPLRNDLLVHSMDSKFLQMCLSRKVVGQMKLEH